MEIFIKLCKKPTKEFIRVFSHFCDNKEAISIEALKRLGEALLNDHSQEPAFQEIANFIKLPEKKDLNLYDLNIHSIYYDPISDKFNSGSVYRDLKEGG